MTVGWMVTEHEGVHAGEEHRQDEPLLFHVPIADHVWACGEEGDGEEPRDLCIGFKLRGR